MISAEAIDGQWALLDLGHDPGDESDGEEGHSLGEEDGQGAGSVLHRVRRDQVGSAKKRGDSKDEGQKNRAGDEKTPSCAQAVRAEEDGRRLRGCRGEGACRNDIGQRGLVLQFHKRIYGVAA